MPPKENKRKKGNAGIEPSQQEKRDQPASKSQDPFEDHKEFSEWCRRNEKLLGELEKSG